jgi:hypothetical protein
VHLRLCLACGHVGCCDESPNRHATAHFQADGHPVIRSFEPDEDWAYCYPDDRMGDVPARPGETAPRHFFPPEPAGLAEGEAAPDGAGGRLPPADR